MQIKTALQHAAQSLASVGIEEAYLESQILVRHLLDLDPVQLHLQFDASLSPTQMRKLEDLIQRRHNHEPIAYITGHKEFFGIDFYVNYDTLIPRPETEVVVETVLNLAKPTPFATIADVGTGCGAIAVSLARNLTQTTILATDVSAAALKVAAMNVAQQKLADRVHLIQADLLDPITGPLDLVVANLPYVSDIEFGSISTQIRCFEPIQALLGGRNGLDIISRLLDQATERLRSNGMILLEVGQHQTALARDVTGQYFPKATVTPIRDLSGGNRAILIKPAF